MHLDENATVRPKAELRSWWEALPDYWKKAFNETALGQGPVDTLPSDEALQHLYTSTVLRFAGPRAPYPNMHFELPNLAGLEHLVHLELLVVSHHQISDLRGIEGLKNLKSLFLFDNSIQDLKGVEHLSKLEEFYCQNNRITSLEPLQNLTRLHTLYCSGNALTSLKGITAAHAKTLRKFHCLPNDPLPQKEIIRVENRLGIRCLKG